MEHRRAIWSAGEQGYLLGTSRCSNGKLKKNYRNVIYAIYGGVGGPMVKLSQI